MTYLENGNKVAGVKARLVLTGLELKPMGPRPLSTKKVLVIISDA